MLKKQLSEKANRKNQTFPLSFGQQALYFLYLNSPESFAYNVAFTVRITSECDIPSLKTSFQKLLNRHPSLRTNYKLVDGKAVQEVYGYKEISFETIDADDLSAEDLKIQVTQANNIPYDLENGDLFNVQLFKISQQDYVLMMRMHHIISDGWSINILLNELKLLYQSEHNNTPLNLPSILNSYSDYVNHQSEFVKSEKGNAQWDYWKKELYDIPVLDLTLDKPRPALQTFNGATVYFNLEKELVQDLKKLSQSGKTTLFVTLLAAYQIFLHKYSGQKTLVTGIPTAGRSQQFESLVGYFINPVAVRSEFDEEITFRDFLLQVKTKVFGAITNQDLPFPVIVERLMQQRDPSRSPVFQTFFGMQKIQSEDDMQEMIVPGNKGVNISWNDLRLEEFSIPQQQGQFDITLELSEGKHLLSGALKYNTDLFDERTAKQMAAHFKNILSNIVSEPEINISDIQMLSEKEKVMMLEEWNSTEFEYPEFDCVHRLIEIQTQKTPGDTAVVFEDNEISYSELNTRANQLAQYLKNSGATTGDLVCICMERSIEMVVSILGVLKAGAAYVPVDPAYPAERVKFMLHDSGSKFILTQKNILSQLPEDTSGVITVDENNDIFANKIDENFTSESGLDNIAYVIYTSGSTGTPKGVMITHRSLANHMMWMKAEFEFTSEDNVFQKTPFSFDASVWEFFLPLLLGSKLVFAKPEGHMDMQYMIDTIRTNDVKVLQLVPSLLKMLLNENGIENCKSLKYVTCGGEALTAELTGKLFEKLDVNFYNFYGPTEVTIDSVFYKCSKDNTEKNIPIGKPVYNTQAYILDRNLNPVPVGVKGELYLGGVDVAKGYLNNPELTNQRFINDIFSKQPDSKLYKTGDLAKYRCDGNIEYLGRNDNQVKLRGFRIELEEIESALLKNSEVSEASVIIREDTPGKQRLVAYIVPVNSSAIDSIGLKSFLRLKLPEYMIPGVFVSLEKLPLTPNGKIDKTLLPVPDDFKTSGDNSIARLPAEEILLEIYKDVLGIESIGIQDNFFELGGDSIISIQIISKANQAGFKLAPKHIFQYQTIAELAQITEYTAPANVSQEQVSGDVKLTPIQHWFFEQNLTNPAHYNHSVMLKVPKNLNEDHLRKAVDKITQHHDALRLAFLKEGSSWKQINKGKSDKTNFDSVDLSDLTTENYDQVLKNEIEELQSSFDLSEGNLFSTRLFKSPGKEDRLLIIVHHLCIDGISWRILLEDLFSLYEQLSNSEEMTLPPKTTSFRNWSQLLSQHGNSSELNNEKQYWSGIVTPEMNSIPADFEKNKLNTADSNETVQLELDEVSTDLLLKNVSHAYNTQINDILLAALIMSYNKWTGESRLRVDLEGHGREDLFEIADVSRTVGWFTSMFPVMLEAGAEGDIASTIKTVKENLRSVPSSGIGFGILKYLNSDCDTLKNTSPSEIVFNYLGQLGDNISRRSDWTFSRNGLMLDRDKTGLRYHVIEINCMTRQNIFTMNFEYSKNLHKRKTIETFAQMYVSSLREIIEHCTASESAGFTPSDFSAAGLDQQELDNLLSNLN